MKKEFDELSIPVVEIVNQIFYDAAINGAHKIDIISLDNCLSVNFFINDKQLEYTILSNRIKDNIIRRIKIISLSNIFDIKNVQQGTIKAIIRNIKMDLDVTYIPSKNNERLSILVSLSND